MANKIEELKAEIQNWVSNSEQELEAYRLKFIGRKNVLADLFSEIKNVPNDQKKAFGQSVNELKQLAQDKFQELIDASQTKNENTSSKIDLTLPPVQESFGTIHPLTATRQRFIEIFERIGFNVSEGPEIEDDWHNFTALNFPENHPAREMQDTFLY